MKENIKAHNFSVNRIARNNQNNHPSMVVWFTGLSGSGKSTIADRVEQRLHADEIRTYSLDGDKIRLGINRDLGFSETDRNENLRRIGEIAALMVDAGLVVLAAFVSPFEKDRKMLREIIGQEQFMEVFVNTSLEECEKRDIKGLYKKARNGEIKDFTGISSPYEQPANPDIELTEKFSIDEAVELVYKKIKARL
ncbi:MAG: adenylyl-sulfate kinase [Bacteroidia bacterium]|jgi:adenylylsulfate kinase